MASKTQAQQAHAKRRLSERYGISLCWGQFHALMDKLVSQIQTGKAVCLGRQSNRVTIWKVQVPHWMDQDQTVDAPVVYDSERHQIVSFLPPEALTEGVHGLPG
jgi:hypothetical protein